MNKVILIGNLTKAPELSTTSGGIKVARFSIAVQRRFKNAAGKYDADFLSITVWRELAETCGKHLKQGNKVGVVGTIQTRTYEQDGVKKYATDIVADEIEFLTPKNKSGVESENSEPRTKSNAEDMKPIEDDDLPF